MLARPSLANLPVYCSVCKAEVPPDRLKFNATTCSREHAIMRKNAIRDRIERSRCKYCRVPSTPERRAEFHVYRRFRKRAARTTTAPLLLENLPAIAELLKAQGAKNPQKDLRFMFDFLTGVSTWDGDGGETDAAEEHEEETEAEHATV